MLNVQVLKKGDTADILLYGYIGEDWWVDEDQQNTDVNVVTQIEELSKSHNRINIRINSPGGSIYHGNAIVTAIKNCPVEIHTYNDGLAASMGAVIFCASEHRHMAKNALVMLHSPISAMWGNAKDLRAEAEVLDVFQKTLTSTIAGAMNMSEDQVNDKYMDYNDHWLSYKDCIDNGMVNEIQHYESPAEDVVNVLNKFNTISSHFSEKRAAILNFNNKPKEKIMREETNSAPDHVDGHAVNEDVGNGQENAIVQPELIDSVTIPQSDYEALQSRLQEAERKAAALSVRSSGIGATIDATISTKSVDQVLLDKYNEDLEHELFRNPNFRFD
jgi:ATP-dependent Clp endopeptidase proteolytic subunit ClpP